MAAEFPVVFALYPRVTQLDFTGPLEVLARLPFDCGRSERAPEALVAAVRSMFGRVWPERLAAAQRAAAALQPPATPRP
jgi:hypothetical protein